MKIVRTLFYATNALMFIILLVLIDAQGANLISEGAWEYKDLIAIILTAVTIILAFIGIIVAVAAIWGFQTLKSMAEAKAIETSKDGSKAFLESDSFKNSIEEKIQTVIEGRAKEAVQDALAPLIVKNDAGPEHDAGEEQWQD